MFLVYYDLKFILNPSLTYFIIITPPANFKKIPTFYLFK